MTESNQPDPPSTGRPPDEPERPYISARLREKLEESGEDDWQPKSGSPITAIVIGVVVLAAAVGGIMYLRSAAKANKLKEDAAAAAAARADSIANIARAESLMVASRADSVARAARADSLAKHGGGRSASAAGSGGSGGSGGGGGSAAPPAPSTDGFGIAVGTYLDEARAKSELDRLSGATALSGVVAPTSDGGFRVILGKYASRGAADRKATALADSGLVREARVVARPR